ncbi:methenyltetrahydrofolate synthase domain-containing protein [Caerostris darwini]|uniref:Methenyltetrahydrofolate synthase domain-containing protein n=1 Tax=Caerostris darwini TaxID=1538125 RepID=A0AAV4WCH9_9ARAC|nr:methenyltetrahydrofolate synthase domain-containing protein [Caerostris darwini]
MDITKESIRQQIWSYFETSNIARYPIPAYNRIPNFAGAEKACSKVKKLKEYRTAKIVKVNHDTPQKHVRFLTLQGSKRLLVPTPHLREGLLNWILVSPKAGKHSLRESSTCLGFKSSLKLKLDTKIKIDLVILGSVAVSPKGHRIGEGEGFADMEFVMLATTGAVNSETVVVTIVHDCQVLDSMPDELFGEHDVPVDIILTPTKLIRCKPRLPKPTRIIWSLLSEEKIAQIPILEEFKKFEEKSEC